METRGTVADGVGEELWGYERPGYAPHPGGHPPLLSLCLAPLACSILGCPLCPADPILAWSFPARPTTLRLWLV